MRTSSKFIFGKDDVEFRGVLKNYFPCGKVAIVAQDKERGISLAKTLGKDYETEVYSPSNIPPVRAGARFWIGVGGSGVISAVKRAVASEKFAFIPAVFDYRFLCDFDGNFLLPEFVFLNENLVAEENYLVRLYQTVFQLYAECVIEIFYASAFPYKDSVMQGYEKMGKKILSGECDKDEFYKESVRFITCLTNEFFARKKRGFVTEETAKLYGVTVGERVTVVRFLLFILKNFTKFNLRAILLPSEKFIYGIKSVRGGAFDEGCLPDEKTLCKYAHKISYLTDIPEPDTLGLLSALKESGKVSEIFSIINNEGITDALYYEKLERNHGIPI